VSPSSPVFIPSDVARRLQSYADESVRRGLLRELLDCLTDGDLLSFLGFLVCRTDRADFRTIYLDTVLDLLARPPWDESRAALVLDYPAIRERQPVLAFLGMDALSRQRGGGQFGPWAMDEVPLGVRKSRARSLDPNVLLVLTDDPEPSVIRILLDNPRCTEALAMRVASKRPQRAQMFAELLGSRFISGESFQNAIVNNPFCPTRISVALVPLLTRAHRLDMVESGSVADRIRDAAAAMNIQADSD